MTRFVYKFPELGEGLHEGEIIKIHIKPGDEITDEDILMEVQNDKAVVEVPSPVNGKVLEVKVTDGQICRIGDVVAIIDAVGDVPEQDENEVESEVIAVAHTTGGITQTEKVTAQNGREAITKELSSETGGDGAQIEGQMDRHTDAQVDGEKQGMVLATPSVRKMARELGVLLSDIVGTGRNGRITREDLLSYKEGGNNVAGNRAPVTPDLPEEVTEEKVAPTTAAGKVSVGEQIEERIALRGIRKIIAGAMVKSVYTAPHVTIMDEADVSKLVEFRAKAKVIGAEKGIKLTYLPFIVKALVAAARKYPILNASLDEERNEIVYKKYYHIGIATDTEQGLLVPVIFDADRKSMWRIAEEISDLAARGREGKLAPGELKGSTITITNIGSAGGMFFTPVINFPEAAILGIGRIEEKPIVKNGEIVSGKLMALSLSFDHRLIDGATAQHFLNMIKQLLADPELLLMEV